MDLQNFLAAMGASVKGAGTPFIEIEGTDKFKSVEYTAMADRIVTGTFAIAVAICGGEIMLNGCKGEHIQSLLSKLAKTSCNIKQYDDKIEIASKNHRKR